MQVPVKLGKDSSDHDALKMVVARE